MLTLDHFVILSELQLRRVMNRHWEYFNRARSREVIEQRIPCQQERRVKPQPSGKVLSHLFLSDAHHDYRWRSQERPSYARAAWRTRILSQDSPLDYLNWAGDENALDRQEVGTAGLDLASFLIATRATQWAVRQLALAPHRADSAPYHGLK